MSQSCNKLKLKLDIGETRRRAGHVCAASLHLFASPLQLVKHAHEILLFPWQLPPVIPSAVQIERTYTCMHNPRYTYVHYSQRVKLKRVFS
jgi:hypothetical protein